jgi:hypothetical protein
MSEIKKSSLESPLRKSERFVKISRIQASNTLGAGLGIHF